MIVTRTSNISGKVKSYDLDVTPEQMYQFDNRIELGLYIQKIFAHLPAHEREFILTGIDQEEWNELFAD